MPDKLTSSSPIFLGIDPGYDRLGWAVATRSEIGWEEVQLGCIQTDRQLPLIKRYQQLETQLQQVIDCHRPQEAAIETLYFANNTTTALKIAEVRGLIIACLLRNQVNIQQYNPVKIKQAVTGNGKADKRAMTKMIKLEFKLKDGAILDDAIDALAVLFTHYLYGRSSKMLA